MLTRFNQQDADIMVFRESSSHSAPGRATTRDDIVLFHAVSTALSIDRAYGYTDVFCHPSDSIKRASGRLLTDTTRVIVVGVISLAESSSISRPNMRLLKQVDAGKAEASVTSTVCRFQSQGLCIRSPQNPEIQPWRKRLSIPKVWRTA